jgi:hypothetical protein
MIPLFTFPKRSCFFLDFSEESGKFFQIEEIMDWKK